LQVDRIAFLPGPQRRQAERLAGNLDREPAVALFHDGQAAARMTDRGAHIDRRKVEAGLHLEAKVAIGFTDGAEPADVGDDASEHSDPLVTFPEVVSDLPDFNTAQPRRIGQAAQGQGADAWTPLPADHHRRPEPFDPVHQPATQEAGGDLPAAFDEQTLQAYPCQTFHDVTQIRPLLAQRLDLQDPHARVDQPRLRRGRGDDIGWDLARAGDQLAVVREPLAAIEDHARRLPAGP